MLCWDGSHRTAGCRSCALLQATHLKRTDDGRVSAGLGTAERIVGDPQIDPAAALPKAQQRDMVAALAVQRRTHTSETIAGHVAGEVGRRQLRIGVAWPGVGTRTE